MRSTMRVCLAALGVGVAVTMFACANTDSPSSDAPVPPNEAGLPGLDAAAPVDAASDVVVDADAALPECSPDGFCDTAAPADQSLRGVWGDGLGIVWAVTAQGEVLRWDGAAWKVHASELGALSAVWGSGPTDIWIGGEQGLYHGTGSTSEGLTFVASDAPSPEIPITSVWGTGPNDVWAVGGLPADRDIYPIGAPSSRVLHYTGAPAGAGDAWTLDPISAQTVDYTRVWGSAATGVWIAGPHPIPDNDFADEVLLFRKPAGESDFTEIELPNDPTEDDVFSHLAKLGGGAVAGDGTVWIVGGTFSSVLGYWKGTSADGGLTYSFTYDRASQSDVPDVYAVSNIVGNDAWSVGDYGRVRHGTGTSPWPQAAITRTTFPITNAFYAAWNGGSSNVWAVGEGIALHLDPSKKTAGTP